MLRLLVFFGGSKVVWLWCPWLWPKPLSKHLNHWIDLCHRRLCRIDGGCTSGEDASAEPVKAKQNWRCFRHSRDHRKRTGTFVICSRKDHQQVLMDPQRQLMYVNTSVHRPNTWTCYRQYRQSADHGNSVLGSCVSGTGGSVGVWPSDPGSAHLILKVDHCRLNLIYVPHFSSCKEWISKSWSYMFLSSATAERSFSNRLRSKS